MSSPSPEQREYAALLIRFAEDDRQAAHTLAQAGSPDGITGFHAQQAVEKAVKSVLAAAGVTLPHTHDLQRLLELAADAGSPVPAVVADAAWLTPWAVQFRYDEVIDTLDEVAALDAADAAVRWATTTTTDPSAGA